MTTTSPAPFPENGQRKLSAKETMQRAKALACTMPNDKVPTCSAQVFVGMFFDGTDNNRDKDYVEPPPEKRKHSNIVRLFHTFKDKPTQGYIRYYVPGVGTHFPEVGDSGQSWQAIAGSAAAWKGEHRILWALLQLLNAPHRFAYNNAQMIQRDPAFRIIVDICAPTSPGEARRRTLFDEQKKLVAALKGQKPKVEQINLSVFGFSRGAAEARTFVNWLFEVCKPDGGGWTFAGIPLRVQFLGIFDTVAAVGVANLNDTGTLAGHQGWADNTQEIHPAVERCVHYVAGHEVRACFPLDSVRVKSSYPGNALEVMYPGSHSDVGGGYAAGALGVSPTPDAMISIIPGFNMYKEALQAGVPLLAWDDMGEAFRKDLTPSFSVIRDFNAYLRAAKVDAGPVEEMGKMHMAYYFSYRFKHRVDFFQRAPYTTASPKDQWYLHLTQECLINKLETLVWLEPGTSHQRMPIYNPYDKKRSFPRGAEYHAVMAPDFEPHIAEKELDNRMKKQGFPPNDYYERRARAVAKRIDVRMVKPEIETFFDRYVHDSMAGFIGKGMNEYGYNSIGFVKFRTVFKGND